MKRLLVVPKAIAAFVVFLKAYFDDIDDPVRHFEKSLVMWRKDPQYSLLSKIKATALRSIVTAPRNGVVIALVIEGAYATVGRFDYNNGNPVWLILETDALGRPFVERKKLDYFTHWTPMCECDI